MHWHCVNIWEASLLQGAKLEPDHRRSQMGNHTHDPESEPYGAMHAQAVGATVRPGKSYVVWVKIILERGETRPWRGWSHRGGM
jgi:hypothetical protein